MATGRTKKTKVSAGEMSPVRARRITAARAERLAVRGVEAAAAATTQVLLCETAGGLMGLPLGTVAQVLPLARIASAPRSNPALIGVLPHGGRLHAVLDLAVLTGGATAAATNGWLLVLSTAPSPIALRVDGVLGVAEAEPLTDQEKDDNQRAVVRGGVRDLAGRTLTILQPEALLSALPTQTIPGA
ncbi:chemotaxis protein CheW [Caulobacter sp. NIBR2454]|uniref:chemotaxis protein CheW n=1 Tax=Caulobacter sp. NIBR2454 TaxID=3015996 RepID=UPI0022B6F78F|nr:chemotaxis protein CheW [Caulobacter sp. NIBR2454]